MSLFTSFDGMCDESFHSYKNTLPIIETERIAFSVSQRGRPEWTLTSLILMKKDGFFFFPPFHSLLYLSNSLITSNIQTTYENFRYRRGEGIRIYDRGCLNNFLEVFCTRISPSKINFRAYVHENGARPPVGPSQEVDVDISGGDRRVKVEDDREIGGDLLKISQRRDVDYA